MVAKKHNPIDVVPKKENTKFRTICAIHRDLWWMIQNNIDEHDTPSKHHMLDLIEEAYECGVRMNDVLHGHRSTSKKARKWKKSVYEKHEGKYWNQVSNTIVVPELRVAFFTIAKNANTSVKRIFLDGLGRYNQRASNHPTQGLRFMTTRDIVKNGFKTFVVCRNPWDRIYSCWKNKIMLKPHRRIMEEHSIGPRIPFSEFVEIISKIPDDEADLHFRSQTYELFHKGEFVPEVILRFEQLSEDWTKFQTWMESEHDLKIPSIAHHNPSRGPSYLEAYKESPKLIKIVEKRYAADIDQFGYTFKAVK